MICFSSILFYLLDNGEGLHTEGKDKLLWSLTDAGVSSGEREHCLYHTIDNFIFASVRNLPPWRRAEHSVPDKKDSGKLSFE